MKGEWCYLQNFLAPSVCRDIIADIKTRPHEEPKMGHDGKYSDKEYRRSKIWFIKKHTEDKWEWLFNYIMNAGMQANIDWFGFHLNGFNYIQVAQYEGTDQGEYKRHQDVFWMNTEENIHRKLSGIIQLSDPIEYDGGDLELYDQQEVPPQDKIKAQGTLIWFPSFTQHAAIPVTRGERFSIAIWIDGPKWR